MSIKRVYDYRPQLSWFDNAIFEVFGDELGSEGLAVYMVLVYCVSSRRPMTLDELADASYMSRDGLLSGLYKLKDAGLVVFDDGGHPSHWTTYDVVDVQTVVARRKLESRREVQA